MTTADVNALWLDLQQRCSVRQNRSQTQTAFETREAKRLGDSAMAVARGHETMADVMRFLRDKDAAVRLRGLKKLEEWMRDGVCVAPALPDSGSCLVELCRLLLVVFGDGTERCRALSAKLLAHFCSNADVAAALVEDAMPLLNEKMTLRPDATEPLESAEEVRLLTVELLHVFVSSLERAIEEYMDIVYRVLGRGVCDVYAPVATACCELCVTVCKIFGKALFRVAKEFIACVAPLTQHRQHRVRVAALRAVRHLLHCGAHEMLLELVAFHNPNIVSINELYTYSPKRNFLGSLATDASATVRLEFLETVGDWLLTLDERLEYTSRLLPYLLSSLVDPVADIRSRGVQILTALGQQYEHDHAEELREKTLYLPKEAHGMGWGDFEHLWKPISGVVAPDGVFRPLSEHPGLGVRLVVQCNFGSFVGAICADVAAGNESTVVSSLELLRVCLLLVEDTVKTHLSEILASLLTLLALHSDHTPHSIRAEVQCSLRRVGWLLGAYIEKDFLQEQLDLLMAEIEGKWLKAFDSLCGILVKASEGETIADRDECDLNS